MKQKIEETQDIIFTFLFSNTTFWVCFCFSETSSHEIQAGLGFAVAGDDLELLAFLPPPPSTRITEVYHHSKLQTPNFVILNINF